MVEVDKKFGFDDFFCLFGLNMQHYIIVKSIYLACTISRCRFGDFVASVALIALTRLQGDQRDWRGIQGVSGITNNNRYMFLKATRLSRRQEGLAGIGFLINSLFLMLLLSAMTIDY